jgi:dTDP-glucose 4,6-dehydratase
MTPRALVTGGAGFLGSHLCERLLADGCEVVCMDNLITGDLSQHRAPVRAGWLPFVKHDVTNFIHVPGEAGLHPALRFAGESDRLPRAADPDAQGRQPSARTRRSASPRRRERGFLLASTSEVYGDPLVHPQTEDYWGNVNPVGPRGVYDEAKRFAEAMTMAYHRHHGVETRIVRIFNTYGPRMRLDDGRVCRTS